MAALEIDLSVDDYTKAVGQRTNGKIVYQIGITPQTSMYFEKSENALYYIEEGTQKFVKRVMTETVQDGELLSLSLDEASISDPILIACAQLASDNTTRFRKFKKFGSMWVFADDQATNEQPQELRVATNGQLLIQSKKDTDVEFARYFWVSNDTNEDSTIIAFSVVSSFDPF